MLNRILFYMIFSSLALSQTIDLDGNQIRIGDDLNKVLSVFDDHYTMSIDTLSLFTIRYDIYKKLSDEDELGGYTVKSIADLFFSYTSKEIIIDYSDSIPTLFEVKKYWDKGSLEKTTLTNFLNKFYGILEKNNLDKYEIDLEFSKVIEPSYELKKIFLQLNKYHKIELSFANKDWFQISELISKEEHFPRYIYFLIFNDPNHLVQKDDIILEKFEKEEAALRKSREYQVEYVLKGYAPPTFKIVKFNKKERMR